MSADTEATPPQSGATRIAIGIFASRAIGLLRDRALSYFFGVGAHADVLRVALRTPNLVQNLLGEGTISAAFIPIYSRLLEEGREQEAGRFAGAIFALLVVVSAALALLGIALARPLVAVVVPGFLDDAAAVARGELLVDRYELAVQTVRIIFPMTAVLTLSAWALGVLNSHRRFFVPYVAPVAWNAAIIGALFATATLFTPSWSPGEAGAPATTDLTRLLLAACWGALAGGALQFLIQLPLVVRLLRGFRLSLSTRVVGVKAALKAFGPVVAGRGVYQLSAYLDMFLAGWIAAGAIAALGYAQTLYILPISLFGLSVAAAELPELSRLQEAAFKPFLRRVDRSLRQMLFMTVPTAVGYLGLGYLIVGAFYRTGSFGGNDTWLVYLVLAAYSLGLVATAAARLLQNAFFALNDTRTPAKIAVVRVVLSAVVAVPLMFALDRISVAEAVGAPAPGKPLFLGAVGLAAGSAVGAWVELWQLRRALRRHLAAFRLPAGFVARLLGLCGPALAVGLGAWWLLRGLHPIPVALAATGGFALVYLAGARLLRLPELGAWLGRLRRRA